MIRVLRVARRGARKARVAAAEQPCGRCATLRGAARPLLGARPTPWSAPARALRPGPLTSPTAATKTTLRSLARRWQQLQAELDQLDTQLRALVTAAAPPWSPARGRGRDRRPATGDRRRQPPAAALEGRGRAPVRRRCHPGVLGPHRPPPARPRRRPPSRQRLVAHRPGPHALPPTDQGLCAAAHQPGPVHARHHALLEALYRPPDLRPAHQPTTHRPSRLPEIGGIDQLNGPVCCLGRCLTGRLRLIVTGVSADA